MPVTITRSSTRRHGPTSTATRCAGEASNDLLLVIDRGRSPLWPQCGTALQCRQPCDPPDALQRGEKLLKPLPDKAIPCDKLPDGPEPVVVEVEYVASQDLQVGCQQDSQQEGLQRPARQGALCCAEHKPLNCPRRGCAAVPDRRSDGMRPWDR